MGRRNKTNCRRNPFNCFYAQAAAGSKRRWDVGDQVFFAQARSAHLRRLPPDRTLGRLVMMMHVMFVDVHFVDKRGDHDCDVVREII